MAQSLTGREREQTLLNEHACASQMIALVGPSGVGKTTIARGWLKNRSEQTALFDCFGQSPTDVANRIASLDGTEASSLPETSAWIRAAERLADVEIVVFDDIGPDFGGLETFRTNWNGVLITTSHHVPEADDLAVLPVAPFEVPDVDDLSDSDSFRLFVAAARDVDVRFELDPDELPAVHELVEHFDGYPLALALAGRRAATLTVEEVLRLVREHSALADRSRPERHQTLDAALDVSWDALAPEDRRLLYSMALFERPVRVEVLAILGEQTPADVLDRLEVLTRSGLVVRAAFPRPIEPFVTCAVRRFPEEEPDTAEEIIARVHEEAARLARELDDGSGYESRFGEGPSLWRFVLDHGDPESIADDDLQAILTAVVRWADVRSDRSQLTNSAFVALLDRTGTAKTLREFASATAIFEKKLAWWALREAAQRDPDDDTRQRIHITAARILTFQRDPASALDELRAAREIGPLDAEGERVRAMAAYFGGDLDTVRDAYRKATELLGDQPPRSVEPTMLDIGLLLAESAEEAVALAERLVEFFARVQHLPRLGEAYVRVAEAHARHAAGLEEALECAAKARALFEKLDDAASVLRVCGLETELYIALGDYPAARAKLEEAESPPEIAQAHTEVFALLDACVAWQLGELDSASRRLEAVRERWTDSPHRALSTLFRIADLGVRLESEAAEDAADRLEYYRKSSDPGVAETLQSMWDAVNSPSDRQLPTRLQDVLEQWQHRQPIQRLVRDFVQRIAPGLLLRAEPGAHPDADLVILSDYSAVRVDDGWVELSSQTLNATLLRLLVESDAPLDFEALGRELYPGETIAYTALKNRVSVQVSRLRKLGLKPHVVKETDGFVLRASVVFAPTTG